MKREEKEESDKTNDLINGYKKTLRSFDKFIEGNV